MAITMQLMTATSIESSPFCEEEQGSAPPCELESQCGVLGENGGTQPRDLHDTDRRKDEFLAMLGHELRNPLAPIRNAMEIFRLKGAPILRFRRSPRWSSVRSSN